MDIEHRGYEDDTWHASIQEFGLSSVKYYDITPANTLSPGSVNMSHVLPISSTLPLPLQSTTILEKNVRARWNLASGSPKLRRTFYPGPPSPSQLRPNLVVSAGGGGGSSTSLPPFYSMGWYLYDRGLFYLFSTVERNKRHAIPILPTPIPRPWPYIHTTLVKSQNTEHSIPWWHLHCTSMWLCYVPMPYATLFKLDGKFDGIKKVQLPNPLFLYVFLQYRTDR